MHLAGSPQIMSLHLQCDAYACYCPDPSQECRTNMLWFFASLTQIQEHTNARSLCPTSFFCWPKDSAPSNDSQLENNFNIYKGFFLHLFAFISLILYIRNFFLAQGSLTREGKYNARSHYHTSALSIKYSPHSQNSISSCFYPILYHRNNT